MRAKIIQRKNLSFAATAIVLILLSFSISDSSWHASKNLHTLLESIATILTLFIGILSLIHYKTNRTNQLFLFLGAGFLGTSSLELYHTLVTSELFHIYFPSPPESLIPWSWFASRLFLSLLLAASFYFHKIHNPDLIHEKLIYFLSALFAVVSFTIFAFIPMPHAYYDSYFSHRPEELLPALLFAYALYGFYKEGNWKKRCFEFWLILSLIINFITQVFFMSYSHELFDLQFTLAHLLKEVGYVAVLIGLFISIYHLFKNERVNNQRLKDIISSSTDFVWEVNEDAIYTYASDDVKHILGYEVDEVVGKSAFDFICKDKLKDVSEQFSQLVKERAPIKDFTNWNNTKDGKRVCLLTNGVAIFDDYGNYRGYRGTDKDITVLEEYKTTIEKMNASLQEEIKKEVAKSRDKDNIMLQQSRLAAMGEMMSLIAHQWRQPISTIAMEANNLLIDVDLNTLDEKEVKLIADSLIKQTQYLSTTIDDFKNFFLPKQEKTVSTVTQVMDDTLAVMEKSLEYHNIKIIKEYDSTSQIDIFTKELLHVFINIIKNAKDVLEELNTENEKYIKLSIYEDLDNIMIDIEDNGGGIKESIMSKVFEPYFSTKEKKNGTGLGLYMSQTIIMKHFGGSIVAKNKNAGACFTISIPKKGGGK